MTNLILLPHLRFHSSTRRVRRSHGGAWKDQMQRSRNSLMTCGSRWKVMRVYLSCEILEFIGCQNEILHILVADSSLFSNCTIDLSWRPISHSRVPDVDNVRAWLKMYEISFPQPYRSRDFSFHLAKFSFPKQSGLQLLERMNPANVDQPRTIWSLELSPEP